MTIKTQWNTKFYKPPPRVVVPIRQITNHAKTAAGLAREAQVAQAVAAGYAYCEEIAAVVGVHIDTARKTLRKLERRGLVVAHRRGGLNTKWRTV